MNRHDLLATAGETIAYAEDYVDTRIEMLKLDAAQRGSQIVGQLILGGVIAFVFTVAVAAFSIALALWLGSLLGSSALGFVVVGAFYALVGAVCVVFHEYLLTEHILKGVISAIFKTPLPDDGTPP